MSQYKRAVGEECDVLVSYRIVLLEPSRTEQSGRADQRNVVMMEKSLSLSKRMSASVANPLLSLGIGTHMNVPDILR